MRVHGREATLLREMEAAFLNQTLDPLFHFGGLPGTRLSHYPRKSNRSAIGHRRKLNADFIPVASTVPLLSLYSEGDAHRSGWDSMIQPSRWRHSRCVIVSRSSVGSYNMRHRFRRGLPRSDGNLSELPDGLPIKTSQ